MKRLRHSDIRLTSKVYTDESQLPIYEAIKSLPRLVEHTQIRAQISGGERCDVTQADVKTEATKRFEGIESEGLGRALTHAAATGRKKRVRGIEPPYAAWEAAVLPLNYTRAAEIEEPARESFRS
jgi:hypothetical protein